MNTDESVKDRKQFDGLSPQEVLASRKIYGFNKIYARRQSRLLAIGKSVFGEPMVLLLLVTSGIYFINKEYGDAFFMAASILLIIAISLYQDNRSRNALIKLQEFTQPLCRVVRKGIEQNIKTEEIVVGDLLIVEEGSTVSADGSIIRSNDFSVNESILTGESLAVTKGGDDENSMVFSGTTVASGLAIIQVTAIGNETRLGKIGSTLHSIKEEKTPLELQIGNFVKKMVIGGALVFILVWLLNYIRTADITESLLRALTLAMSILPEEIPVAFTTFMALGAWRLMKLGIVVKQMKTVETLGSATVICTDKTGTITENRMELACLYLPSDIVATVSDINKSEEAVELITVAMWASEPIAFDPMEIALHNAYSQNTDNDLRPKFRMVHEYPLSGKPPMMTHIFQDAHGKSIVAAKGAPEAILEVCTLPQAQRQNITKAITAIAAQGYRVLGVGQGKLESTDFPERQQEMSFQFKGLLAFYDPPKKNIAEVLCSFYQAGIAVKIITGDNAATTGAIAKEIGFKGFDKAITGEELMKMNEAELKTAVEEKNIFSRMFPDAKLKIVNALKANEQIVAMTGDGVNDGPALKAAHIGIAMGKKGTAIAKDAASLIIADDDLSRMVEAIAMGRKIYTNLKKAIQYIISIHIPIILIVFLPLALGWLYPNIFSPLHVILLELIMGPTCSIIYENEPAETDAMLQAPRPFTTTFFKGKELFTSILQGLIIALGTLLIYQWCVHRQYDENLTRSMVFVTLIIANIFLTLVNRSFHYSLWVTLRYKNALVGYIIAITFLLLALLFFIPFLRSLFGFKLLTPIHWAVCVLTGMASVTWYEIVKYIRRRNTH